MIRFCTRAAALSAQTSDDFSCEKEKMHQGSFLVAPEISLSHKLRIKLTLGIMRSPGLGTFSQ